MLTAAVPHTLTEIDWLTEFHFTVAQDFYSSSITITTTNSITISNTISHDLVLEPS